MLYSTRTTNIIIVMQILLLFFTFIFSGFFQNVFAEEAEFGQYRYSQYLGVQQQLQNQRINAIRRQRIYSQNPTRNIRYPSAGNPYPNIQRTNNSLNARQRYSSQYYNQYYR